MVLSLDNIRNVVFVGHSKSGKTTLLETILARTGAIPRAGSVDDGSSILDFDEQERERKHTIDPTLGFFSKDGVHVNTIDTSGFRDFVGNVFGPLRAVEGVVFLVDADEGVRPFTRKLWNYVENEGLPRLVVISRADREAADFSRVLEEVRELSSKCVPLTVPVGVGTSLSGVEYTFGEKKGSSELAEAHAGDFMESVVESDEELLEKYLGDEEISAARLQKQIAGAVRDLALFPVLCTSVNKEAGLDELVDAIINYLPPSGESLGRKAVTADDEEIDLPIGTDQPLLAYVFRTISDPFVGKLSVVRVFAGEVAQNGHFANPSTGKAEKLSKITRLQGKEQVAVETIGAGDIVALLKVEILKTFDSVCATDRILKLGAPNPPTPMYGRAMEPKTRTDEKKFSEALTKVTDEDPGVTAGRDSRTKEMVVSASSQLHLQVIVNRLKSRFNVEVNVKEPKIPYLETITGTGDHRYRHKKQTGGAGEFAEVALRLEPVERGTGLETASEVFGGAISESYVQSSLKGVRAIMEEGVIAGYPMVDVKVIVYDGKEHPVDSKDVAFQKAGREAFKAAVESAKPVLLEPIVNLEVTFPIVAAGDINGDLNRRRARVQGMDTEGDFQILKAQVPLAELTDYSNALGAMTGGQGSYELEISHYEMTPGNVQQKIIAEAKAARKGDS